MKRLSLALFLMVTLVLGLVSNDRAGRLMLALGYPAFAAHMLTAPAWRRRADYKAGDYRSAIATLKNTRGAEVAYISAMPSRATAISYPPSKPMTSLCGAIRVIMRHSPDRQLVQSLMETKQQASLSASGLASSTAAKEKQGGENKASDDDDGTKSTSGDGMAGQREAAGSAQMAGSSKVDRRGDAQESELIDGMGSAKGAATDSGGSSGKNGGQTTSARVNDTEPEPDTLEAKLETEQATLQWLAKIPDDPIRFLRLRISAEYRQRQEKGIAVQSKDSLW